ncbi:MAG: hypothetical protein WCF93_00665 [Candidatus Moraniibacteriota bacterium]
MEKMPKSEIAVYLIVPATMLIMTAVIAYCMLAFSLNILKNI